MGINLSWGFPLPRKQPELPQLRGQWIYIWAVKYSNYIPDNPRSSTSRQTSKVCLRGKKCFLEKKCLKACSSPISLQILWNLPPECTGKTLWPPAEGSLPPPADPGLELLQLNCACLGPGRKTTTAPKETAEDLPPATQCVGSGRLIYFGLENVQASSEELKTWMAFWVYLCFFESHGLLHLLRDLALRQSEMSGWPTCRGCGGSRTMSLTGHIPGSVLCSISVLFPLPNRNNLPMCILVGYGKLILQFIMKGLKMAMIIFLKTALKTLMIPDTKSYRSDY